MQSAEHAESSEARRGYFYAPIASKYNRLFEKGFLTLSVAIKNFDKMKENSTCGREPIGEVMTP
jgi:hypothetical protein